ncbi:hypothetical protein B0H19DRAFT_1055605 [Mycena capillaripes]|nr:hypothetical protein B0H19DRAFT_1055605 [Mycena capillaripes]
MAPLLLDQEYLSMAEIYDIIAEKCTEATPLVPHNIPLVMVLKPVESEPWLNTSDVSMSDTLLVWDSMNRIIPLLVELIVYGGRGPSFEHIQSGVSAGSQFLGFRGKCLMGILDLQLILLRYCIDGWTMMPPPGHDLGRRTDSDRSLEVVFSALVLFPFRYKFSSSFSWFPYPGLSPNMPPSPSLEFARLMGGPLGRAIANEVERACDSLLLFEISECEWELQKDWDPPLSIPDILSRVVRPSIFILQQAVNPSFARLEGTFHLPESTYRRLQASIRKLLELLARLVSSALLYFSAHDRHFPQHLISIRDPIYPSHVDIWESRISAHIPPPEPPVSDRMKNGFQILDHLVAEFGFTGHRSSEGCWLRLGRYSWRIPRVREERENDPPPACPRMVISAGFG